VASPEAWDDYNRNQVVNYRKNNGMKESEQSTAVWLHLARNEALQKMSEYSEEYFDREKFKLALDEIRKFTCRKPEVLYPEMVELCRKSGVILVIVPEFKTTHISGAAVWLNAANAMIALSLRYKTNDQFWFTFFHEAAHLLFHAKKGIYIDTKAAGTSIEEKEADKFASDKLIPEMQYQRFTETGIFTKDAIVNFAHSIGIHAGIVVGRLQHEKRIPNSFHNELKERWQISPGYSPQEIITANK
jgi:Zn-dependent peptidase ImmA (M78 family)